jgi:hypothetical protein
MGARHKHVVMVMAVAFVTAVIAMPRTLTRTADAAEVDLSTPRASR